MPRNGWDYDAYPGSTEGPGRAYTPDVPDVGRHMGTIAAAVVARPGRVWGDHRGDSFAAVGPVGRQPVAVTCPGPSVQSL